jgi:hypothetical protein
MDGLYNTRSFGRVGRTGQAATQLVELAIENEIPKKHVISVAIKNKLCYKGAWLMGRGFDPKCGTGEAHFGCKANVPHHKALREYDAAKEIGMELAREELFVHCATTDGDSSAVEGLKAGFTARTDRMVSIDRLADKFHLGQTQFRRGSKAQFSRGMLRNVDSANRKDALKCISSDIAVRSAKIFDHLFSKYEGSIEKMSEKLAIIVDTTVECYSGNCKNCSTDNQCGEGPTNWWTKSRTLTDFGLKQTDLNLTTGDELLIRALLEMKLSKNSIKKLKYNTTTQKAESVNRRINSCANKSVTHLQNFEAKVHSAIHSSNNSREISVAKKRKMIGLVTGGPTISTLRFMDRVTCEAKEYKHSAEARNRKSLRRSKRNKCYYEGKRSGAVVVTDYSKDKLDSEGTHDMHEAVAADHPYSVKSKQDNDHTYSVKGTGKNPRKSQRILSER